MLAASWSDSVGRQNGLSRPLPIPAGGNLDPIRSPRAHSTGGGPLAPRAASRRLWRATARSALFFEAFGAHAAVEGLVGGIGSVLLHRLILEAGRVTHCPVAAERSVDVLIYSFLVGDRLIRVGAAIVDLVLRRWVVGARFDPTSRGGRAGADGQQQAGDNHSRVASRDTPAAVEELSDHSGFSDGRCWSSRRRSASRARIVRFSAALASYHVAISSI